MADSEQSTLLEIKNLIQSGAEIDIKTRDIILFSAIISLDSKIDGLVGRIDLLQPVARFYKAAAWSGAIAIGALITLGVSGHISVVIK